MTAVATVAYFASLKGLSRKTAKERAYSLLERYGLGEFAGTRIEALSKGMALQGPGDLRHCARA